MLEFLKKALPWVVAGLLFTSGWYLGSDRVEAKWKEEVSNEYIQKSEARADTQREVDSVSAKYQADLEGLEGSTDRVIADLRRDNKRLRVGIKPASGTTGPDGRCIVDGKAELDEATTKRLVGITTKGDLQIEALQNTIRKLQGK